MREILYHSNNTLLREFAHLEQVLQTKRDSIPQELDTYYDWVIGRFEFNRQLLTQNIKDLESGQNDILSDILSSTQSVTRELHLFDQRLLSPITRSHSSDGLCLKLLRWLHSNHTQTQTIPLALSDGDFASWPAPPWPTIYFMPPSAQQGLLYLPLFFHEFGHLLYASHKLEMDDLVRELTETISQLLTPSTHRDDSYAQREIEQRNVIVETWYSWAVEIFCDAVGFVIGGPAYAYAFSRHLQMLGRGQYHLPSEQLANRVHPVTWLRMRLIAYQMRSAGFVSEAEFVNREWGTIASALSVSEEYYGYYLPQFMPAINEMVKNMLIETSPRAFSVDEVSDQDKESYMSSPVHLLNQAWYKFLKDPADYECWEISAIETLLPR